MVERHGKGHRKARLTFIDVADELTDCWAASAGIHKSPTTSKAAKADRMVSSL
jgi:hypothetical protein